MGEFAVFFGVAFNLWLFWRPIRAGWLRLAGRDDASGWIGDR